MCSVVLFRCSVVKRRTGPISHIHRGECEKVQLIDGVCQKHRPLVFLAGLLLVKEYATCVKFHTGSEI